MRWRLPFGFFAYRFVRTHANHPALALAPEKHMRSAGVHQRDFPCAGGWPVVPERLAAIVSVVAEAQRPISYYKDKLKQMPFDHVTIEVNHWTAH
jgi:hypothetical protein